MPDHVHLLVRPDRDGPGAALLRDLKSYASQALNRQFGKKRWWTRSGSKRCLKCESAVLAAARYIARQHNPLLVWVDPTVCGGKRDESGSENSGG